MESSTAFGKAFNDFTHKRYNRKTDDALQKEGRRILEKYSPENQKIGRINSHSVFWMITSFSVFYFTDFYEVLLFDRRINRLWLMLGGCLVATTVVISTFLILYYHYFKRIKDYEKEQPFAVPIATITFITGIIALCFALWPIWGFFTPVILFTLCMGVIFFLNTLPL